MHAPTDGMEQWDKFNYIDGASENDGEQAMMENKVKHIDIFRVKYNSFYIND